MPFVKDDPRINREGRPPGVKNFTTKVREALEKIAEGKDYSYEEAFIKSILKKAIVDGDVNMQKHIWNHLDGMPVQKQEAVNTNLNLEVDMNPKGQALAEEYEAKFKQMLLGK